MRRHRHAIAVAISICLHLVGGAWLVQTRRDEPPPDSRPIQVEIVSLAPPERRSSAPRDRPSVAVATPPILARTDPTRSGQAPFPTVSGDAGDLAAAVFAEPRRAPAIKALADCLTGDPDRLSAADRRRCDRDGPALESPVSVASSKEKADELKASAARKAAIVQYRNTITAPYPGLNCVLRGRCSN